MKYLSRWLRLAALAVVLAGTALSGCTVKTTVQTTATTPANVSHLYVTVKELWFTSNANATPTDNGWVKKVLSTPVTIDLASLNDGSLATISSISLAGVTYAQIRLVLADSSTTLTSSADDLGLSYNNVVQYVDSSGASHVVPLELATPDSSLLIPISIKLNALSSLSALSSSTTSTTSTSTTSTSTQATATITMDIDALRSLNIFTYGDQTGAIFDPGLHAYDDSNVGTINGTFDVSALSSDNLDSAQGIIVSAETLDPDGTHFSIVKSTRMGSDGSFTLYPLPVNSDTGSSSYDIVVHGPGVETLIISGVTVSNGETTTVQDSDITLPSSTSFVVNTTTSVPGGTLAEFYQTLPSNSVPYAIETASVNPFGTGFTQDVSLATSALVYGAYNDGNLISFASVTAQEGTASYQVVSDSRWRGISNFGTNITGASSGSTTTQTVSLLQPNLPSSAVARTISGVINFATAGKYDTLYLVISRGGQIVDAVNLSSSLGTKASINFSATNIPGGTATAVYDVAVRAWNSSDAANTLTRVAFATQADLRQSDASGLSAQL